MNRRVNASTVLRPAERGLTNFNAHRHDRTAAHWFTWRHLRCKLQETQHYGQHDWTLLQLEIIAARTTPCPLTTTGYLAHGLTTDDLRQSGGAVPYMTTWLNRAAATKAYQQREFHWRQGDLFEPRPLEGHRR